jgi:hypothetical protein
MRGKLLFITGGLVGYVLGARAGRKRYEQIASAASDLWNRPPVQRRVNEVRDFALERVGDVPGVLFQAGKKVVSAVQDKSNKGHESADAGSATAAGKAAAAASKSAKSAKASADAAETSATTAGDQQ